MIVEPNARRGCVYFVGAGPGDPGLLTLRGAELLRRATIVFHDRLVGDEILQMIPPEAKRVDVGKESTAGGKSQERINRFLIDAARASHVVVRLKGGDPFVFGRGGEEALACAEAGVPFEVVPGVTSAIAAPAYAGIPVTHRGLSANVCVVTGHGAERAEPACGASACPACCELVEPEPVEEAEPNVDWTSIGKGAGTLVILMGVERIERIVDRLLEAGRAPDTPVALIRHGTRSEQETLVSTLSEVAGEVKRRGFRPPAAFVVGKVVGLRSQLAWVEKRPLFGLCVAVTRPEGEAEELSAWLRAAGAKVVHCPTIRIEPKIGSPEVSKAIEQLGGYDWLILTSVNGVRCFFRALEAAGKDARALAGVRVAVIGSKTGRELERYGVRPDLVPREFSQEGVLEAMPSVKGSRILLARAAAARDVLPDTLRQRDAAVDVVSLYETVANKTGVAALREQLAAGGIDLITFTSASTAQFLLDLIPAEERPALFQPCRTASIGPSTSGALRAAGLRVDIEAKTYTSRGLFEAIVDWYGTHKTVSKGSGD